MASGGASWPASARHPRHRAILGLASDGLSAADIATLRIADLRFAHDTGRIAAVVFPRRHGLSPTMSRRRLWVVLSPATVDALEMLIPDRSEPTRPLFPSQRGGHLTAAGIRYLMRSGRSAR
ncbi:MAG: hypothetical protein BWX64_01592 [Acidobacteria bacterium ADurb.Bin051]|nr:MAG: hypothetical protein BWX64_01592 [Acidobacteria bacterium ADurb.Bin051]